MPKRELTGRGLDLDNPTLNSDTPKGGGTNGPGVMGPNRLYTVGYPHPTTPKLRVISGNPPVTGGTTGKGPVKGPTRLTGPRIGNFPNMV